MQLLYSEGPEEVDVSFSSRLTFPNSDSLSTSTRILDIRVCNAREIVSSLVPQLSAIVAASPCSATCWDSLLKTNLAPNASSCQSI